MFKGRNIGKFLKFCVSDFFFLNYNNELLFLLKLSELLTL